MSCREEILSSIPVVKSIAGTDSFSIKQVMRLMQDRGTSYAPSTIRTEIVSRMCANAPRNHVVTYRDIVRVGRGTYRLQ